MTTATVNTIKAAQRGEEYRVEGYLVRFTDASDPDLHGEYFDKRTYFWEKERPIKGIPILIDHAFDSRFKGLPVGIVDFVKEDEIGKWIEGKLHEREEYIEYLQHMRQKGVIDIDESQLPRLATNISKAVKAYFDTGQVQWSSGAHPQLVEVDESDGHIKSWAFIEATAVMTPAEPEGTEIRSVKKALDAIDNLLQSIPTATATKEANKESKGSDADHVERGGGNTHNDDNHKNKDNIMAKQAKELDELEQPKMDNEELVRQIVRMVLEESKTMFEDEKMNEDELTEAVAMDLTDEEGKMDEEHEKMDEEELAESVAEKAWSILEARANKRRKALANAQGVINKFKANRPAQAQDFLPNASGKSNGALERNGRQAALDIRTITPYDNWSPADFSFAMDVANRSKALQKPILSTGIVTKAFMNQYADKAIKAYQGGNMRLSNQAVKFVNAIKADELDYSTQAGFGDEWVFTDWREQIWDTPRLDLVYTQIQAEDMPSNPYEVPVESTDPTVFFVAETADEDQLGRNDSNAAIPDTKIATNKVQLNAKKHALRVNWSAELQEDAISTAIPKFRSQAQRAVEDAIELTVLLGDTSTSGNINLDTGTPGATTKYLAYDGLLHQALVTATTNAVDASGNAPSLAHIRQIRSKLGNAQGYNPNNLAIFTDFPTYMKLLSIDAVVTLDKMGEQATVKTGSLGQIDGINIFVSGQMALADTDGKITDGGNVTDTGRLIMVYTPDWYRGYRRRIASHVNYLPFADAWEMVLTVRTALSARSYSSAGAQQSSDDSVSVLYNIGV